MTYCSRCVYVYVDTIKDDSGCRQAWSMRAFQEPRDISWEGGRDKFGRTPNEFR